MTVTVFDITEGVHTYGWKGNRRFGDCVEVAFEDLRQLKYLHNENEVARLWADVHGIPGRAHLTFSLYAQYLATLGEKPSPTIGSSPTGFLAWCYQHGLINEWASIELGTDRVSAVTEAADTYHGAMLTLMLTADMYQGFDDHVPWGTPLGYGETPLPQFTHEVALVRATPDYLVVATWDQNKLMTIPCAQSTIVWCNVFLTDADEWDVDYQSKLDDLRVLRTGNAQVA